MVNGNGDRSIINILLKAKKAMRLKQRKSVWSGNPTVEANRVYLFVMETIPSLV
jgi:hypothetical protein